MASSSRPATNNVITVAAGLFQRLALFLGEPTQHPVCQIIVGMGLFPHAQLHPGKIVPAQQIDDILEPVVTAGTALAADAQPSRCQGDVITDHQQFFHRDLVELHGIPHRFT